MNRIIKIDIFVLNSAVECRLYNRQFITDINFKNNFYIYIPHTGKWVFPRKLIMKIRGFKAEILFGFQTKKKISQVQPDCIK